MSDQHHSGNLHDFVDQLNFVKEQIGQAIHDPDDQLVAIHAASMAVPVIAAELFPKHEFLWTLLMLRLPPYFDSVDGRHLAALGMKPRDEFLAEAARLLNDIDHAQSSLLASSAVHGPSR